MAVAFDAFSADDAAGTGTRTWTHTPVGTPRGVVVAIVQITSPDEVTTVTYGSLSLTEASGSPITKSTGEAAGVHMFVGLSAIPTGAQTVTVNTSASTATMQGYCVTLTAGADTEVIDVDATVNSDGTENPSVTLSLAGRTCFAMLAFMSGQADPTGVTPLSGWTSRNEIDAGSQVGGCYTYDTIGTTDVTAGWTQAIDDAQMIAIALSEVVASETITVDKWLSQERIIRGPRFKAVASGMTPPEKVN